MSGYRTDDIALASAAPTCTRCHGYGGRPGRTETICACVYRAAFRACLDRYQGEQERMGRIGAARWQVTQGGWFVRGIPAAEYCADFILAARRVLNPRQLAILELFFLQDRAWFDCLASVGLDRGDFFHAVYKTEERMGQALIERGLFPTIGYFGTRGVDKLSRPTGPGPNSISAGRIAWRGTLHQTGGFGKAA